jgi:hypothetical protein
MATPFFLALLRPFIFYFWIYQKNISRLLLLAATLSLLIAIPLSISRSLFFSVIISMLFTVFAIFHKPKYAGKMIAAGGVLIIALMILNQAPFFQTAIEAFTARFDKANEAEGGVQSVLADRYLGGMVNALQNSSQQTFFGYGLGMGTNVGSVLLSGRTQFLISEGEWGRVIGELGPLLGLAVIFLRLGLCWRLAIASYHKLALGKLLPWILLSFCLLSLPQGQWAQPTSLGFSVLIGGLMVASLKEKKIKKPARNNANVA